MLAELVTAHDAAADGRVGQLDLGLSVVGTDKDHPVVAAPVDDRREGQLAQAVSGYLHRLDSEADMPAGGGDSTQGRSRNSRADNVTKRGNCDHNAVPFRHHRETSHPAVRLVDLVHDWELSPLAASATPCWLGAER